MKTIQTDTRYSMVDRLEVTEPTPGVLSLTARWDGDRNIVRRTEHLDGPSDITRTVNRPRPDRSTTGVLSGLAVVLTPTQALELASALTTFATATPLGFPPTKPSSPGPCMPMTTPDPGPKDPTCTAPPPSPH